MKILKIYTLLTVLLLGNCQKLEENHLLGKWKAIEVLQDGVPLTVDLEKIYIQFEPKYYEYHSTLNHREAGTYYLKAQLLFTKDTIQRTSLEKAVEIAFLSKDSLFIRMNEQGKERILKMVKEEGENEKMIE